MNFSLRIAERRSLLVFVDLLLVNVTVFVALFVWAARGGIPFDRPFIAEQLEWFVFLSALWIIASFLVGLYDLVRITNLGASASALAQTIALIVLAYLGIYFLLPEPGALPRGIVLYQGIGSFVLIVAWRGIFMNLIRQSAFARKAVIVGAGRTGRAIAELMSKNAAGHYQILGFVDDDAKMHGQKISIARKNADPLELPILGGGQELVDCVKKYNVAEVVLAITKEIDRSLFDALLECKVQGVEITLMPELYEQLAGQVPIDHIGNNWTSALPLETAESGGWYPIAKRVFDLLGAAVGLIIFLPLCPIVALAIRLDSPGPIFYSHTRVGKGGRLFKPLKLRTMIMDAEKHGAQQAQENDPCVTRVGRYLRKMRLDEMPQLVNVLKGEMSAVGPRPERPEHLKEFDKKIPFHRLRNSVKPGMAGWAVINYDYIDSVEDAKIRLQYDLYYIKHQSIMMDMFILMRTIGHVFAFKGR